MLDELDAISAEVDKAWLNLFEEGVEKLSEAGREVLEQMHEMVEKAGELDKIIALASTLATRDEIKTLVGRSFRKDNKVRIVKAVTKIRASHKGRPTGTIQWKRPDDKRGLTSSVKDFRHWLIGAVEVEDA